MKEIQINFLKPSYSELGTFRLLENCDKSSRVAYATDIIFTLKKPISDTRNDDKCYTVTLVNV